MKKPKSLFLSFFLIFATNILAADLVTTTTQEQDEIKDDVLVSVNNGGRTYRPYTVVPGGGNGSTSDQPFVTYLAYQNSSKTSVWEQFTLGDGLAANNGPIFIGSIAPGSQFATFPVEVDADGRRSLFVAIKDTSDSSGATWAIIKIVNRVTTESQNDLETTVSFDPNVICTTYLTSQCSNLASGSADRQTFNLFFFLADNGDNDNNIVLGNEINPSDYSGKGLYWDLKMSARPPAFASGTVITLKEVRRGDKRILLDYVVPSSITDFKEIMVIYNESMTTSSTNEKFQVLASTLTGFSTSFDDYGQNLEGVATLRNLKNGVDYAASIGVVDFYYLAPAFSPIGSARPAEIEELLKDQNCFFLTAGFGEDHPVIRGFRAFRDQVLLKTTSGKIFVGMYYKIAPLFAPKLYQHEGLRWIVRTWSMAIYQLATHLLWIGLGIIPILAIFSAFRRKRKRLSFF